MDIALSLCSSVLNPRSPAAIVEFLSIDLRKFMWVTWTISGVEFYTLIDGLSYVVYSLFSFLSFALLRRQDCEGLDTVFSLCLEP